MGDRANIFLVDDKVEVEKPVNGIYLYTHWSGREWPERLRKALIAAKPRWDDPPYLNRIIVSCVFADIHEKEVGGGISTMLTDNSYPIIVCNSYEGIVAFVEAGKETFPLAWQHPKSFAEYIDVPHADYPE